MHKYKPGDKVILLDYNGKPIVPYVVAKIEDIIGPDRVRLFLPDHACCLEFIYRLQPIDEDTFTAMLGEFDEKVPEEFKPAYFKEQISAYGSIEAWKDDLFRKSIFTDKAKVLGLTSADLDAVSSDPAIKLCDAFDDLFSKDVRSKLTDINRQINLAYRDYMNQDVIYPGVLALRRYAYEPED